MTKVIHFFFFFSFFRVVKIQQENVGILYSFLTFVNFECWVSFVGAIEKCGFHTRRECFSQVNCVLFSENRVYLLSLSLLGAKMSTDSASGDRWVKFEQSNPRLYRYLPRVTVKDVGDAVKNDNFEYSERLSKFFVNKMIYLYTVV